MKDKYKIVYRDERPDEEITCDGLKQTEDTVVFVNQTTAVDKNGNPGAEVFLICHWSDIEQIRKLELANGVSSGIALAH